ncbi:MAG: chemotaxis protein CheB [Myxococcales bacterium]|nr:MAG: chemotaxis protein CheB [Myxococcales bacterium]
MVPAALSPRRLEAIVVGGSAGSIAALEDLLPGLPADGPPVLVVVHLSPTSPSHLADIFQARCAMRVCEAEPAQPIERGVVYFAPSNYHLLVEPDRRCALSVEPPVHFSRPSIDVLFESAADVFGASLAAVVLSGANEDGAQGLRAVARAGGLVLIQQPDTARVRVMPDAALAAVPGGRVLPVAAMLGALRGTE